MFWVCRVYTCAMMCPVTAARDDLATERDILDGNLTEEQLAGRYRKNVRTVKRWRRQGKGPRWFKDPGGRVFYRQAAILAWEQQREAP